MAKFDNERAHMAANLVSDPPSCALLIVIENVIMLGPRPQI